MDKNRVGILTFPDSPSFGASLQMCGMYYALEQMGFCPEVINYTNPFMGKKAHITGHNAMPVWKKALLQLHNLPSDRKFRQFEDRIVKYPKKQISDRAELSRLSERYDKLVCGSDQVWNPYITGNDMSYFFDFCQDDRKKVAYAPSFGLTQVPEECEAAYRRELAKFAALSAREQRGCEMVKELTGRECLQVLDPSMLADRSLWKKQSKKPRHLPEHYIASFIFNPRAQISDFISRLSRDKGLPVVTVGGGLFTRLKDHSNTGPIGPDEWLYVLEHADYVVTDSFHGAAFSIIFERPLFVSLASSTNSRLVTLMDTFDMHDRVIGHEKFCAEGKTDYEKVGRIMEQKRTQSLQYLKNSLLE